MADLSDYSGPRVLSNVSGIAGGNADGNTGEMRRKYNFAEQFTELSLDQTPFFRIVSKIGKKPTDDPQFKFTEKRQSWMKRYGYVLGHGTSATVSETDADLEPSTTYLFMGTDYKSQGNLQNIIGQNKYKMGDAGTRPLFYLPHQVIKVNYGSTVTGSFGLGMSDYALYRVLDPATAGDSIVTGWMCHDSTATAGTKGTFVTVDPDTANAGEVALYYYECTRLNVIQVKAPATNAGLCSYVGDVPVSDVAPNSDHTNSISGTLEAARSYVVGTAYTEGSTLMEVNWSDQPYSTGHGLTQIFRTEFGMTNTARATALKYEPNEWARLWRDKLIEHKWEIEQTALFGKQVADSSANVNYTQGAVDYVLSNGNLFDLTIGSKTQDDFLEDLSMLIDPRYNNSKSMMFFCDTSTYNWLHKLGGYFSNNLEMSPNFNSDFAVSGKKKSFGIDFTTISTVYGDINVARNIHLDGSGVKILGVNMSYAKWRPLVGNGVNRDTSVYVGVQTLENTGTDKRVDMILTEGGFEFSMPECHALWK